MPIYEFRCEACSHVFEQILPIDAGDQVCPECDHEARRLISRSSFQLKGSGWYATGYKPSRSSGAGTSGGKGDGRSGSSDESGPSREAVGATE